MSTPSAGNFHTTARGGGRQHDADWAELVRSRNLLNRPLSPSPSSLSSDCSESLIVEMRDVLRNHDPYNYDRWPQYQALGNIGGIPWNRSRYSRPLTTTTGLAARQVGSDESCDMNLEQRSELLGIDEEQRPTQSQHIVPSTYLTIPRLHLLPPNEQHLQRTTGSPPSSSQRSLQREPRSHLLTRARRRTQIPTISYPTRATMHRITRQTSRKEGQMSKKLPFWELDNRGAARRFLYRYCKRHT